MDTSLPVLVETIWSNLASVDPSLQERQIDRIHATLHWLREKDQDKRRIQVQKANLAMHEQALVQHIDQTPEDICWVGGVGMPTSALQTSSPPSVTAPPSPHSHRFYATRSTPGRQPDEEEFTAVPDTLEHPVPTPLMISSRRMAVTLADENSPSLSPSQSLNAGYGAPSDGYPYDVPHDDELFEDQSPSKKRKTKDGRKATKRAFG